MNQATVKLSCTGFCVTVSFHVSGINAQQFGFCVTVSFHFSGINAWTIISGLYDGFIFCFVIGTVVDF